MISVGWFVILKITGDYENINSAVIRKLRLPVAREIIFASKQTKIVCHAFHCVNLHSCRESEIVSVVYGTPIVCKFVYIAWQYTSFEREGCG